MYSHVLVTGGCGFIGSHLVDRLVADGVDVTVLDNLSSGCIENLRTAQTSGRVEFVRADVRDRGFLNTVLDGVEVVFHEAAAVGVPLSLKEPLFYNDVNINGTLGLLDASVKNGVKRFVFASSAAVYGDQGRTAVGEGAEVRPCSPYAVSKLSGEWYCRVYFEDFGLETVVLRYFNVYGERQKSGDPYSGVITKFVGCLSGGKKPIVYGDGLQTRDFVHVDDVVEANLLAVLKSCAGGLFNVASGKATSIIDLLGILKGLTGCCDVEPEFSDPRDGDIAFSQADMSRAREILGFVPKIRLEDGLARLVRSCS